MHCYLNACIQFGYIYEKKTKTDVLILHLHDP
jgi:hypothetical protein